MVFVYVILTCVVFTIVVAVKRYCNRQANRQPYHVQVPARDIRKGHRWCIAERFSRSTTFCNITGDLIYDGYYCDSCGICVSRYQSSQADRRLPCKALSMEENQKIAQHCMNDSNDIKHMGALRAHHWIKGNLPIDSVCSGCGEWFTVTTCLADRRCCWCARTVHDRCVGAIAAVCDLGVYKEFIVPADCVKLKQVGIKGRRHFVIESVKIPDDISPWKPLIVVANRKSGKGDGERILEAFRGLLNPAQVIDLADMTPEVGLEWCRLLPSVTCQVLAAGGDGTVGWVLSAIDHLQLTEPPQVCILPLGTGNDLSRVLGWGPGYTGDVDIRTILDDIRKANVVILDRWKIDIIPEKHFPMRRAKKSHIMNNYASIGVDALVTLNFHRHRESSPSLFGSRFINRLWYLTYGTKDVLERECKNLHKKVKLELDGKVVDLPEIEGIVMLNIASWGGGCRPWDVGMTTSSSSSSTVEYTDNDTSVKDRRHGSTTPPSCDPRHDDGLVEVFALYSAFHIAQIQVGLAQPLKLGQARTVKITLSGGNAPMQIDGEPWEQHPAVITLQQHNQVPMLANSTNPQ